MTIEQDKSGHHLIQLEDHPKRIATKRSKRSSFNVPLAEKKRTADLGYTANQNKHTVAYICYRYDIQPTVDAYQPNMTSILPLKRVPQTVLKFCCWNFCFDVWSACFRHSTPIFVACLFTPARRKWLSAAGYHSRISRVPGFDPQLDLRITELLPKKHGFSSSARKSSTYKPTSQKTWGDQACQVDSAKTRPAALRDCHASRPFGDGIACPDLSWANVGSEREKLRETRTERKGSVNPMNINEQYQSIHDKRYRGCSIHPNQFTPIKRWWDGSLMFPLLCGPEGMSPHFSLWCGKSTCVCSEAPNPSGCFSRSGFLWWIHTDQNDSIYPRHPKSFGNKKQTCDILKLTIYPKFNRVSGNLMFPMEQMHLFLGMRI